MGIIIEVTSAIISLVLGGLSAEVVRKFLPTLFARNKSNKSYSEKLSELTSSLNKSSEEVDKILSELTEVSKDREESLKNLKQT